MTLREWWGYVREDKLGIICVAISLALFFYAVSR